MTRLTTPLALMAALALAACQPAAKAPADAPADPAATATQTAVMPADAPPQEEASGTDQLGAGDMTCTDSIGAAAAQKLVDRCIAVSPATHPPCNADNICAMIQDEIDRSCAQYGPGETKPSECIA